MVEPTDGAFAADSTEDSLGARLRGEVEGTDVIARNARAKLAAELFGAEPAPAQLGRYRVLRLAGAGGMGAVYVGHDDELDRPVALKVLLSSTAGPAAAKRMLREAQTLARVSHPNVAAVYEVSRADNGVFIAMEFIDGETVSAWAQAKPRSTAEVVAVFMAVGEGLQAIHAAGLLHRDVKPANILVDTGGRARIVDFGLAKLQADALHDVEATGLPDRTLDDPHDDITANGAVVGTPAYIAPELWLGGEPGPASDQFSYCVALFEVLVGKRPFDAPTWASRQRKVAAGPVFPTERKVPRRVRAVLARGLAEDPADRFGSLAELVAALQPRRRSFVAAVVAGGALVASAIAIAIAAPGPERCAAGRDRLAEVWTAPRRAEVEGRLQALGAHHGPEAAARVTGALDDFGRRWVATYHVVCAAGGAAGELDARMRCLDDRFDRFDAWVETLLEPQTDLDHGVIASTHEMLPAVEPCLRPSGTDVVPPAVEVLQGELRRAEARARAGRHRDALALLASVMERAEPLGHASLTAEVRTMQGRSLHELGDTAAAEHALRTAFWEAAGASADRLAVGAAALLIEDIAPDAERYDEAKQLERHARVHVLRVGGAVERARLLDAVARVELMAGNGEAALRRHTEAYAIWAAHGGEKSEAVGVNLILQGETLITLGRFKEARDAFAEAHALFEASLGSWHPLVASALSRLGNIEHDAGNLAAARANYERALEIIEATGGTDSPEALVAINGLALTWEGLGDPETAAAYLERVVGVLDKGTGEQLNRGATHESLGRVLAQLGRFEDALAHQRLALDLRIQVLGEEHPLVSGPLHGIGECLVGLGRSDEALEPLQRALKIRTELGAGPHYLARTRFVLARALVDSDPARARALGEQAQRDAAELDAGEPEEARLQAAIAAWLASR